MNFDSIKKVKRSKPFTVVDGIVIAVVVAAIAICLALVYTKKASVVRITAPDFEREYDLSSSTVIELEHLTVHIEGGAVWVTDADCPDKTCVAVGKIDRAGQSIVCLPSGVVVTILGEGDLQAGIG